MSPIRLAPLILGLASAGIASSAAAFDPPQLTASHLYSSGTLLSQGRAADGSCYWSGQEPEGSRVFAWDSTCQGSPDVWGYDTNADGMLDAVIWLANLPQCGGVTIRRWQWYWQGSWSEGVYMAQPTPDGSGACALDSFVSANGATCDAALAAMKQRFDQYYQGFTEQMTNPHPQPLELKGAWHRYNQAALTLHACRLQLAPRGPPDERQPQ
jgi:hypothetical protein